MVVEDDRPNLQKAESLRNTVLGEFSPYKGRFRRTRTENKHLLACLFSSEPVVQTPMVAKSFDKKDYSYLKPHTIMADCTKRELNKFGTECWIWLEKTLSEEDKRDKRLIYASIKIDPEWDEILSRDTSIQEKNFDQIFTLMLQSYLDRNPLIIQRLTALRITRAKDEQ